MERSFEFGLRRLRNEFTKRKEMEAKDVDKS